VGNKSQVLSMVGIFGKFIPVFSDRDNKKKNTSIIYRSTK
jgi:hypothetical protein